MTTRRHAPAVTVVLTALIAGGITVPAYGAPGAPANVPDAGVRPTLASTASSPSALPLPLPPAVIAAPESAAPTPREVLETQIAAVTSEIQVLAPRQLELERSLALAAAELATAGDSWRDAGEKLRAAEAAARETAVSAYITESQVPPALEQGSLLRELEALQPHRAAGVDRTVSESAARDLQRATSAEASTFAALTETTQAHEEATAALQETISKLTVRTQALEVLQERYEVLKTEEALTAAREAAQLIADYTEGQSKDGLRAHPDAVTAVRYALDQLGKPYRFADEGPDYFDCSGLVWSAYRSVGVYPVRVSRDQYYQYRKQPVRVDATSDALLPGDLLFYAHDPGDWRTIHHVMIYIGDGKMVYAPTWGDVVKITPVNWAAVDFAVRVIDAVPVAEPEPTPEPTPTPSPTPSPTPTPEPEPTSTPEPTGTPAQ